MELTIATVIEVTGQKKPKYTKERETINTHIRLGVILKEHTLTPLKMFT